jgi:hypothetical protein
MSKWKEKKKSVTSSQKWNHVNEKLTLRMRRAHEWMAIIIFDDFRFLMFLNVWSRLWEPHFIGSFFLYNRKTAQLLITWVHPQIFDGVCVDHLFSFLFHFYFFILFVFVLCLVPNVACISRLSILGYPFGFL